MIQVTHLIVYPEFLNTVTIDIYGDHRGWRRYSVTPQRAALLAVIGRKNITAGPANMDGTATRYDIYKTRKEQSYV